MEFLRLDESLSKMLKEIEDLKAEVQSLKVEVSLLQDKDYDLYSEIQEMKG